MKTVMFLAVMNAILATASRSLKNSGLQPNQITAINFQLNFASLPSMPSHQCKLSELYFSGDVVVAAVFVVIP